MQPIYGLRMGTFKLRNVLSPFRISITFTESLEVSLSLSVSESLAFSSPFERMRAGNLKTAFLIFIALVH